MRRLSMILAVLGALTASCEDSVDPSGDFAPRMAVFAVLSTETDTQYVRVFRSFLPEANGEVGDLSVRDAVIQVSDGIQTITFEDTAFARGASSDFGDSVFTYVAYNFKPSPGTTYTMSVVSPTLGSISGITAVPNPTLLNTDHPENVVLRNPWSVLTPPTITFLTSPGASAYMVKLTIEYEDQRPEGLVSREMRIPDRLVTLNCPKELYAFEYRGVINPGGAGGKLIRYQFPHFAYRRCVELVNERSYNNRFLRARFTVVQFNDQWYKYYRTARIYEDRFSVRIDQPDYSGLKDGLGLLGAYVVDTVSVVLPAVMMTSRPDLWSACE